MAYCVSGRRRCRAEEYKAALAVNPKFGEAHSNLAVVYLMSGRYEQAEEEVQAAEKAGVRVDPTQGRHPEEEGARSLSSGVGDE